MKTLESEDVKIMPPVITVKVHIQFHCFALTENIIPSYICSLGKAENEADENVKLSHLTALFQQRPPLLVNGI